MCVFRVPPPLPEMDALTSHHIDCMWQCIVWNISCMLKGICQFVRFSPPLKGLNDFIDWC